MLGLALAGSGVAGWSLAQAAKRSGKVQMRAVVDTDPVAAERVRRVYPEADILSWDQVLDRPEVEAVAVALPAPLRQEAVEAALEAGKHVLVCTPVSLSLEGGMRLVEEARRHARVLYPYAPQRYTGRARLLERLLHDHALGDIFLARLTREHARAAYVQERPWLAEAGILRTEGTAEIDLVRHAMGEVEAVYARRTPSVLTGMAGDETTVAVLELVTGATAVLVESFATFGPDRHALRIHGSRGTLVLEDDKSGAWLYTRAGHAHVSARYPVPEVDAEVEALEDFLRAVEEGETPGERELGTLRVVEAAYRSMQTGQRVPVGERAAVG